MTMSHLVQKSLLCHHMEAEWAFQGRVSGRLAAPLFFPKAVLLAAGGGRIEYGEATWSSCSQQQLPLNALRCCLGLSCITGSLLENYDCIVIESFIFNFVGLF